MDDSEKDSPTGSTPDAATPPVQPPIGGMVRDPREIKTNPSLTKFLRERMSGAFIGSLVSIGILRPRTATGELGPRSWKGFFAFLGAIFAIVFVWSSIHIVQPGTVAVPVTLGHPGKPLSAGVHITLPFTTAYSMSTRTQNYTMTSVSNQGPKGSTDTAVAVLGSDGGAAAVNATVLFRLDPSKATDVFRNLGTGYATSIVRPTARSCIRLVFTRYDVVAAATAAWSKVESDVGTCMKDKIEGQGLFLQDFQLKEVTLDPNIAVSVNQKVTAQQIEEQQKFLEATAVQQANITRIQALATADSQQILACGGVAETIVKDNQQVSTVVPNPLTNCNQTQLTPAYLQFTYIQALKQLVSSPNVTTLILPFDKNLTPLLQVPSAGSGSTSSSSTGGTTVVTAPSGG